MFKFLIVGLILITFFLLSIFIDGIMKQHMQEKEDSKNISKDGLAGYLAQSFGNERVKIFKSIVYSDGILCHLVYVPRYEWFKSPKYQWFEVYASQNGFHHSEIQR